LQDFIPFCLIIKKIAKGDEAVEAQYFWKSMDDLEQVVIGNGEILLLDKNGESTVIGATLADARKRLAELGKDEEFPDFMNDYNW
jgi:tRNA splicing endonuclease